MKKISKLLVSIGLLATATTGCTDLDVDITSQYTEYPDSEIAIEAKMANVYYSFRAALGRRYNEACEFSSDEFTGISFDGDYYDNGDYALPSLHKVTPDTHCVDWYGDITAGITNCNRAIVDFGGEDAPAAAPALAMRAFYHFILMDMFGATPILDHLLDDDEAIDRSPRPEVAAFIEQDLLKALPNLTQENNASTYGKPNYWMAKALLAKLYINWGVYSCADVATYDPNTVENKKLDECIAICDEIMQQGPFDLSDGYREKFWPENGSHIKDFIYAMPYDRITAQGMTYARFRTWRQMNGPDLSFYGFKLNASVGGMFAVNSNVVDLLSLSGDERNLSIVGGPVYYYDENRNISDEPYIYDGNGFNGQLVFTKEITLKSNSQSDMEQLNTGKSVEGWSQGYKSVKWFPTYDDYLNGRNQSNDVPIFRYADIILTKAEALLRGGASTNGDTPQTLLNQIRAYVNAPAFEGNPTLDDILDERGREFFDENWRRNDLIRFGRFEDDWGYKNTVNPAAKTELFRRIFPIPTGVMETNTNWTQNPGY
ncbi:MAG TPA: RagB/SusD family nutrient uptake outer membrane protein [Mediterranea massiliensis]|uniref:RagB/SusD family nutrient uptake outer membrane protein n=1 Tax=Mediterranea massiliensis TaxID=1841865 RepID=A0A921HV49_9BACT|nr:RagB/SusD family nutrient uptake outer membrane protein [Mediterranea massiliensis]HJF91456.1 RagB/SusD family nutrient uptake outer membrane protein [Mediterranea massiliensis]